MSLKISPPNFTEGKPYERYKLELLAWREVTEVAKVKQGIAVALSLPETEIREKVFDELDLEELKSEGGFDSLLKYLDKQLGKDDLADSLEKFEDFEDFRREPNQTISDFISKFDSKYTKIQKKKMTLPSEILAFKLLRCANISKEEKMLVMTGMNYDNRDTLYEQAKSSLKKFLGQQSGPSEKSIKVEPTYTAKEEVYYGSDGRTNFGPFRGRGFRSRGFNTSGNFRGGFSRGGRSFSQNSRGFSHQNSDRGGRGYEQKSDRRPTNPLGPNGRILTCLACGSFRHLVAQCPDSWENLTKTNLVEEIEVVDEAVLFTGNDRRRESELNVEARNCAVLDSACSSTVCGKNWMNCFLDTLSPFQSKEVTKEVGSKTFRFGGGERLKSLGHYEIPAVIAGQKVKIKTDVVDSDIPLLLSIHSMKEAKVKLDLETDTAEILGQSITLNHTSSGHYCLPIDGYEEVPVEVVHAVSLEKLGEKELYTCLTKLHRQFAHPPVDKLVSLLKDAGSWDDSYRSVLVGISDGCEICRRYKRTPPRPAVSMPMASRFNEKVAMDLKKWRDKWILHLVDMWSRLTVSVFIQRKTTQEVIDKIMTHWIGAGFGVMEAILSDNGGEFSSDEMREVASILNVQVYTTAAESPFHNGICERIHSVCDNMLLKLEEAHPDTPLSVLLAWANMARNALQMWHGYSSYQLVFGKNPNLPNIMTDNPPALQGTTTSEILGKHLNALHSARKAYIESESSERIRRALRCKVRASEEQYSNGDRVYYKREGHERWLGPAKVVFQDGKVIFVRHGGTFVRVSPNRLIKAETETVIPCSDTATVTSPSDNATVSSSADAVTTSSSSTIERHAANTSTGIPTIRSTLTGVPMMPSSGAIVENEDLFDVSSQRAVSPETVRTQPIVNKTVIHRNDRVKFKSVEDEWKEAVIVGRGGKATGKYKNWYNVRVDGDTSDTCVDFDALIDWELIEPQVHVVSNDKYNFDEENSLKAKLEELEKFKLFETYETVEDLGQRTISTRWVLSEKGDTVKARLVARGFEEVDFDAQKDSPTVGKSVLRLVLAIAASRQWSIKSTDIKSAFLQGKAIERDVYLVPPKEAKVEKGFLWKLKHCLYGLNDAARQFFQSVKSVLFSLSCSQSQLDPAMFYLRKGGQLMGIVVSHIDDFLHCGDRDFDRIVIAELRQRFLAGKIEESCFKYIGFHIDTTADGICLDQTQYLQEIETVTVDPKRASQKQENMTPYELSVFRGMVGKLNWLVQGSRPDMAFEMIELSTKFQKGTISDLLRAVKVMRRLKEERAKISFPCLGNDEVWRLVVFSDAAHANICEGVGSVGAHVVFLMGHRDRCCPLAWHAGKIKRVVRSTLAAEALSLQESLENAIYIRTIIKELLNPDLILPIDAYVDNKSVVEAVKSTKLVDDKRLRLDIGALRESLCCKEIRDVYWCPGSRQLANCMTKRGASNKDLLCAITDGQIQWTV